MLRFAICDDDTNARNKYINGINKVLENHDIDGKVVFDSSDPNIFLDYLLNNPVDIAFLDVDLRSNINGIELGKKIREINKSVYIVYITGHIEYVMLAFKVAAFDYLVKPVSQKKLEECILRLHSYAFSTSDELIKIASGHLTHILNKNSIIYIEKVKPKTHIFTNNEIIQTYASLDYLEKILPKNFQRIHKSFIVNTDKISRIDMLNNEITLNETFKCLIGRKYKKLFSEGIKNG